MLKHPVLAVSWLTVLILAISSCSQNSNDIVSLSGETMGTSYNIKYHPAVNSSSLQVQDNIDALLQDINQIMSTYIPDSELMLLNADHKSSCIPLSTELFYVIEQALHISEISNGAFDITIGPMVNLWGFGPNAVPIRILTDLEIENAAKQMGYENIELNHDRQCMTKLIPELWLDLSAIAKGYAVDKVAEALEGYDITHYMVEIGGEIKTRGKNANGLTWRIGIETPDHLGRSVHKIIALHNTGMATSGDYRNYFESNNQRYTHIINPETGRPVEHTLASVTVLHTSAMMADGLATAFMVMGPESSQKIIEQHNTAAYMIFRQREEFSDWASPVFTQQTIH